MSKLNDDFDKLMSANNELVRSGLIAELELVLAGIKMHKLTEVYQVEGLINNRLDVLRGEE
jgi:hypothetical protein